MFPTDAITIRLDNNTINNNVAVNVLPSGTYTILNISFHSQSSESSSMSCGGVFLVRHYATFNTEKSMAYLCNNDVTAILDNKTSALITYVPYNLRLISTTTATSVASSTVSTINGFTYGEVLVILILLMIFTQAFFSELKQWFFGVRIENPMKNKYNKDL